jgi:uridine phosphorylase
MPGERAHHLDLYSQDVGRFVFLPGDPGRCERIAARFDDARQVGANREFVTWSGHLSGTQVSVTSTGVGGPSAAIAVEELVQLGADTFIRVGTSGAMQPDVTSGTLAVVNGAIRDEGTTRHYLPQAFPAVADFSVTRALVDAAVAAGCPHRVGVAQSKDSFYGQHDPDRMPVADRLRQRWSAWVRGGALCSEMEAAAIFVVASTLHVRAGAVVTMQALDGSASPSLDVDGAAALDRAIDVAVLAMSTLIGERSPQSTG